MVNVELNYVVHDAKVQLYFYIASDISKKFEKKFRNPNLLPSCGYAVSKGNSHLVYRSKTLKIFNLVSPAFPL